MRIFIVDDDARLRSFLIHGFVELDFTVAKAADAIEAREHIATLGEMLDLLPEPDQGDMSD